MEAVVDNANGYPFFIQQCGYSICEEIGEPGRIDYMLATIGMERATEEFDRGIYKSRWDRATQRGRQFMIAMAQDSSLSSMIDVVASMGKKSQSGVSPIRDSLISSGLIYVPERGCVAFTIPGMKGFIERSNAE